MSSAVTVDVLLFLVQLSLRFSGHLVRPDPAQWSDIMQHGSTSGTFCVAGAALEEGCDSANDASCRLADVHCPCAATGSMSSKCLTMRMMRLVDLHSSRTRTNQCRQSV